MVTNKYIGEMVNIDVQFTNTGYTSRWFTVMGQLAQPTLGKFTEKPVDALIKPGETLVINAGMNIPSTFTEEASCDVNAYLFDRDTAVQLDKKEQPREVYIKTTISGRIVSKTVS